MAIDTPVLIGTNNNKTANTSIAVTVGAAGVPAGSTVFVGLAMADASGAQAVADTAGNTYVLDQSIEAGVGFLVGLFWFRATNISALVDTNTITASWTTNNTPEAIIAVYVTGLANTTPLDQTTIARGDENGGGPAPNSGSITTTTASQIIFGFLCYRGPVETVLTQDADFTTLTGAKDGTTGGTFGTNRTAFIGYRIVSATETNDYHPTAASTSQWACGIASYKAGGSVGRGLVDSILLSRRSLAA